MWETRVRSLDWEDLLEKEKAAHSSIAWRIPWRSTGSEIVRHDWETGTLYMLGVWTGLCVATDSIKWVYQKNDCYENEIDRTSGIAGSRPSAIISTFLLPFSPFLSLFHLLWNSLVCIYVWWHLQFQAHTHGTESKSKISQSWHCWSFGPDDSLRGSLCYALQGVQQRPWPRPPLGEEGWGRIALFETHCLKLFLLPAVNSVNHLSLAIIGLEWSYVPNPKLITGPAGWWWWGLWSH